MNLAKRECVLNAYMSSFLKTQILQNTSTTVPTAEQTCEVMTMYEELRGDLAAWATHFHFNDETSLLLCKAADAIEELTAELEYTKRQYDLAVEDLEKIGWGEWIPVTERLPDVGEKVLVLAYANDVLTARMRKQTKNGYPVFECNGIFLEMAKPGRITHWMPLPQPPKEET